MNETMNGLSIAQLAACIENSSTESLTRLLDMSTREIERRRIKERSEGYEAVAKALNIRMSNIQRSHHAFCNGTFHGITTAFDEWMKKNQITKRFCEWNGNVFLRADFPCTDNILCDMDTVERRERKLC